MKKNIIFFGSGWYTIPVIDKLIPHGLNIVVTTEKNPKSEFIKYCQEKNLKTLSVSSASDLINHLPLIINHNVAVLASFGAIIPDEVISSFKYGILNIHPSLLPKYKGPSPIQYQLLNGETIAGVTVIKLDDRVDHGPILSQKPYNLIGNETSKDLLSILFEIGSDMVEDVISKFENGEKLDEIPQDHTQESWSHKITKKDGNIDISQLPTPISQLQNMIRAFYPWPGVWLRAELKGQEKIIKLLPEKKIQVEGKNPMTYKDFLNGYENEAKNILAKLNLI